MPALAQTQATEQGAADIRAQIRASIVELLGPTANVPANLPIEVKPDGDHYRMAVPLGDKPDSPRITADARPSTDGTWALSHIMLPTPATFTAKLPKPEAGKPDTGMSGPVDYKITIGQQDGNAQFDPNFKTPTTSASTLKDLQVVADSAAMHQVTHVDSGSSSMSLTPGADGKLDLVGSSIMDGYNLTSEPKGANPLPPVEVSLGHVTTAIHMMDVSREGFVQTVHMIMQAGADNRGAGAPKSTLPADAFATMAAVASGFTIDQSGDNVAFKVQGVSGSFEKVAVKIDLVSKDGLAQGGFATSMNGFKLGDLGLGDLAQFVPTRLELHPTVSGVPTGALVQLFQASSNGGTPSEEQINAVFGRGGVTAGLESLSLDVAGSTLQGAGKLVFASPQVFEGTGQVSISNFDALQQKLAADPNTAQALPAVIFLKGVGKTVGDKMVWDITYKGQSLLVNGTDMSAMIAAAGGGGGPKPQAQPEPKAPVPPPSGQLRRRN